MKYKCSACGQIILRDGRKTGGKRIKSFCEKTGKTMTIIPVKKEKR
jgi:DNA-directed RNA polymerase subunit RPC12/RpoP